MKYEPVLRKPTKEEESLFTPEFLESLFESGDEEEELHITNIKRRRE